MPQPAGKGLCAYTDGRESRQMMGGGEEKKERERKRVGNDYTGFYHISDINYSKQS